ncbi:MAG: hypothetical protein NTV20_01425 [Candidatus Shapirobacteria bacterium]|nr:hypothetical protein [Candidatus Shapirobacteria bacterium]
MIKKPIKKPKLVIFIISLVVVLSLVQLTISYWLATTGGKMRQLEEKTTLLEQQNKILSEEINHLGSLARVNEEARSLSLVKATNVLYLTPQIPVALETKKLPLGR